MTILDDVGRLLRLTVVLGLLATLPACDQASTSSTGPAQSPAASAEPSPSPVASAEATPSRAASPHRYTVWDLQAAIPPRYKRHELSPSTFLLLLTSWSPREDPLKGHALQPESCREAIRVSGLTKSSWEEFASDTPAALGSVQVDTRTGEATVAVRLVEFGGALGVRFSTVTVVPAPECRDIAVGSARRASIKEWNVAEFGPHARYIVRTYPRGARTWTERILLFVTDRYVGEVRMYGPIGTEADFFTFARQVKTRAATKLR